MNRRRCILSIFSLPVADALGLPAALAQEAKSLRQIAFVEAGSSAFNGHFLDAFRQGLAELGYVEGRQIVIEARWAEGRNEYFERYMAELVQLKVDVIVVTSGPGALAAKNATMTIPTVFVGTSDPVALGLVSSLSQPGGNMTGLTLVFDAPFVGKWGELIREVVPSASTLGLLRNVRTTFGAVRMTEAIQRTVQRLGARTETFEVRTPDDLDAAFAAMISREISGLIVVPDPLVLNYRARIIELAAKHRLPALYAMAEFARDGGLIAYSASVTDMCRRAATYVDKILKGASPGELPVEQPTKFGLVVNLKTAKALGLTFPASLLARADEVIE